MELEKEEGHKFASFSPREIFARMPPQPFKTGGSSIEQSTEDDDPRVTCIIGGRRGVEITLRKMGFNQDDPIDWGRVKLPAKTELHTLLHHKITNFVDPDILIKIGNHEYRCHLLVLQCYSEYFVDNALPRLEISEGNVSQTAFTFIYEWMLQQGGDSFKLIKMDNILDIYMAAQFLRIEELVNQCEAFIDNEDLMSEDRAFSLYLDARAVGNTAVMMDMVPRIQRFFLTLVASKEFLELSLEEVCIFLRSNFICIHCEMEVFMAAVRWLLWDWDARQQLVVQIMSCVRFGLITPWQLVDIRRNPKNQEFLKVTADPQVTRMLEDGLAYAIVQYGKQSSSIDQVIENFGLQEPVPRNWAGPSKILDQKKYETYQDFLNHLSEYRRIHVLSNKGRGDKGVPSSESLQIEIEHASQMINSPDFIMHHTRS